MSRVFKIAAIIASFIVAAGCEKKQSSVRPDALYYAELVKKHTVQLSSDRISSWLTGSADSLSLLLFTADWSESCRQFQIELVTLLDSTDLPLRTALVNADQEKKAVELHEVSSLPTLKFYRGSQLLFTSVGPLKKAELRKLAGTLLSANR